jgi:hypothetical protein
MVFSKLRVYSRRGGHHMATSIAKDLPTMSPTSPPGPPEPAPPDGGPEALLSSNLDVDLTVELSGYGPLEALAAVEAALATARQRGAARIWFRFPKADGSGTPTLFQPVGRALKSAIADGRLVRAMPGIDGGWIARVAGVDSTAG